MQLLRRKKGDYFCFFFSVFVPIFNFKKLFSLRDLVITGRKQNKDLLKKFEDCYIDKTSVIEIEDEEEEEEDVVEFSKEQRNIIINSIRGGSADEVIFSIYFFFVFS